jgi:hypothetical protein
MRRSSLIPDETDPPLIVDPDRVLTLPVCPQGFEAVARGNTKVAKDPSLIQETKLAKRDILNIGRQSSASMAGPDQFCFRISKALNHGRL